MKHKGIKIVLDVCIWIYNKTFMDITNEKCSSYSNAFIIVNHINYTNNGRLAIFEFENQFEINYIMSYHYGLYYLSESLCSITSCISDMPIVTYSLKLRSKQWSFRKCWNVCQRSIINSIMQNKSFSLLRMSILMLSFISIHDHTTKTTEELQIKESGIDIKCSMSK